LFQKFTGPKHNGKVWEYKKLLYFYFNHTSHIMKVKITSIWTPITFGIIFIAILSVLKLLDILDEEKIEVMSFILGIILMFFYFPRLAYVVIKKDHHNMENIIN